MPTYTFTRTLPEMEALVLRKLGSLGVGETVSADDAAVVSEAIDLRLKELHALGVLWFNVSGATTNLVMVAGTATVSLSAVTDFLFPVSLKLRIGTDDQDIEIVSHRQYQDLPNKADQGEPEKAFVSGGNVYFWPTPDDAYTAKLTYQSIAADNSGTTTPDIPVAMMRALVDVVAGDLIDDFMIEETRAARLVMRQREGLRTILTLNTERVDNNTVEVDYF